MSNTMNTGASDLFKKMADLSEGASQLVGAKGGNDDVVARVLDKVGPFLLRKLGDTSHGQEAAAPGTKTAGDPPVSVDSPPEAYNKFEAPAPAPAAQAPAPAAPAPAPAAQAPAPAAPAPAPAAQAPAPAAPAPAPAAQAPAAPAPAPAAPAPAPAPAPARAPAPAPTTAPAPPASSTTTDDDLEFNDIEDASAVLADKFAKVSGDGKGVSTADLEKLQNDPDPAVRAAAKYMLQNPSEWRQLAGTDGVAGVASAEELDAPNKPDVEEKKALSYNSAEDAASVLADNFKTISPDGKGIDQAKLKELAKSPDETIAAAATYMLDNPADWKQVSSTWGTEGVATASELKDAFKDNVSNMDLEPAADALNKNWAKLDPKGDGIDEDTLRATVADENASPELRSAAKYLLDNPDEFSELKSTMGDNSGNVMRSNIEQYIANQSDADQMDPFTAASTLRANFTQFSPDGKPLTMDQLKDMANNGKTPELREAARYLLNNPQDFQAADTALGQAGDQTISFGELGAAVDAGGSPMDPREAGLALKKNWATLDPENKGLTKDQLMQLANDPKQPDDVQKAARYYLANEGAFDGLDTTSSPKPDQRITMSDVQLAADGFDPNNPNPGGALTTLMQQYEKFQSPDGTLHVPADLQRVLDDPNSTPEMRTAAATILRDPQMQVDLENITVNGGRADGWLNKSDVMALWEKANPDPNLENMSKAKMYEVAIANFGALAGDDGQIEQEDLRRIQRDPNASREVRAMADQLLNGAGDNGAAGDLFRNLAMTDKKGGDNAKVSIEELKMALEDETTPPMSVGDALSTVLANHDKYSSDPGDIWGGKMDKEDLKRMATDPNASPQARQAAKLLLANPEVFTKVDTVDDGWFDGMVGNNNDGIIMKDDLKQAIDKFGGDQFPNPASAWNS